MENEISPGVKVRVRVRDGAPTKQTPTPQQDPTQASPFRGKCPVRTLGDGGARLGQVPSPDLAALSVSLSLDSSPEGGAKNEASPFRGKCPVRTLGDGGARLGQTPSSDPVALSVTYGDSSPEGGAKGVDENSHAPQGAAPLRGSGAERRRGLQSGETADREKTVRSADHSFPSRHSPSPGAPSVANAPAPPKGGAKNEAPPALRAHFERLCAEAEALHRAEPGFDLDAALHDPRFLRLTAPGVGVPVADAWYALHRDEYAEDLRRESMERAAAAVAAGRLRPREGGRTSGGELMGTDPRHMSRAQRAELKERIKRGEKVYPGV